MYVLAASDRIWISAPGRKSYDHLPAALTGLPVANIGRAIIYRRAQIATLDTQLEAGLLGKIHNFDLEACARARVIEEPREEAGRNHCDLFYIPLLLLIADRGARKTKNREPLVSTVGAPRGPLGVREQKSPLGER